MDDIYFLKNCELFKNIKAPELIDIFSRIKYRVKKFDQDEVIMSEYDDASRLGIIIEGIAEIQKGLPSGKNILIKILGKYQTFGEATLFSNIKSFPVIVISKSKSKVIMINKQELVKLFSANKEVIKNFLGIISNRAIMHNSRLELISENSIRKKISSYLLNEANNNKTNTIHLMFSKTKLANFLNIPRPSLSRELKRMKEDGLITFDRRKIVIEDIDRLEQILFK